MKPILLFSLLLAFASMPVQADTDPTPATPSEVMTEDPSDGLACASHADALVISFEADTFLVAERALGVEDEFFAGHEGDPAGLEFADANLRPLQVAENADRASETGGDFADAGGALQVVP